MNLKQRLIIAFGIASMIPLVGGMIGIWSQQQALKLGHAGMDQQVLARQVVDRARSAQVAFKIQVQEWKNILLRGEDPEAFAKYLQGFEKQEKACAADLLQTQELCTPLTFDPAPVQKLLKEHALLGQRYREALKSFVKTDPKPGHTVDALVKGMDRETTAQMDALVLAITKHSNEMGDAMHAEFERNGNLMRWIMAVGTLLGVLCGIVFGILTTNAVARYVRDIASRMMSSTEEMSRAVDQVSGSSQNLADGSSKQAASLEETSASMEEIAGTIGQNADSAKEAHRISNLNRQATDANAVEVEAMQGAMQDVSTSSANIAKIVKSIDEIAFQTNILALNAAVEAARAGEAGAGFAVVAEEVRSLAQRSATAARETASLIEDALSKSQRGAELSTRITTSLRGVVENTRKVDDLIGQIARASEEQAQGIKQVTLSLHEIDHVTQANTATSEETAAAARELESQTKSLRNELALLLGQPSA